jgi:hypothetical protein
MVPRPYGARTLFRVGALWGVTADQVVRMADGFRRRAAA